MSLLDKLFKGQGTLSGWDGQQEEKEENAKFQRKEYSGQQLIIHFYINLINY